MRAPAPALAAVVVASGLLAATGCRSLNETVRVGAEVLADQGVIKTNEAAAIVRSTEAFARAVETLTPEQEYYLGRAVGAGLLATYRPVERSEQQAYLNVLGQTLAAASERPETFAGYRFLLLDTDEINAFAAPGGFIFVTRGMVELCEREDELAAVLAHEVGHVERMHALRAIAGNRWASAALVSGLELLKLEEPDLGELTKAFEEVADGVRDVLLVEGYGRRLEMEADRSAVEILRRVGYEPLSLATVLARLEEKTSPRQGDFGRTHPQPARRIADVRRAASGYRGPAATPERATRFAQFVKGNGVH